MPQDQQGVGREVFGKRKGGYREGLVEVNKYSKHRWHNKRYTANIVPVVWQKKFFSSVGSVK